MLKLILQTQEGQQIEVVIQPDDTFGDLKRHYGGPENSALPEFLKHLIINGTDVEDDTKILDYVTNNTSLEWLMEETHENINDLNSVDTLQTMTVEVPTKECCVHECFSTELTTPNKMFFPLPTDHDRLSSWLIGIARPELFDAVLQSDSDVCQKYFVCSDHFEEHQFLKGTNQVLKRRACPSVVSPYAVGETLATSVFKPNVAYVKAEIADYSISETDNDKLQDDQGSADNDVSELFDTFAEIVHPGVLCRLCGEHTVNPVYLYEEENQQMENTLADKINLCLPITVNVKDPLPKQLCHTCHEKLNICHKLATTCLRTEDKLKTMLRMKQFYVEDTHEKQCPLCLQGDMHVITKSGIYRKDKLENNPEMTRNSSARTRQVTVSKNIVIKTEKLSKDTSPFQDMEDVISKSEIETLSRDEDAPTNSVPMPESELSCSICCRKVLNYLFDIQCHASYHTGYPCIICKNVKFKTMNEQNVHFLRHGYDYFCCEICATEYNDINEASEHIKLCKSELKNSQCDRCGEQFLNVEAEDKRAYSISKEDDWFECDQCGKKFRRKANLNMHVKMHEKKKENSLSFKCSFCDKQFTRKGSLHNHISISHSDVDSAVRPRCYKCKKCDEVFASAISAGAHITEKHFGQLIALDTNCTTSDQFTAEELNLTRVYICEYCEQCYASPNSLHEHKQSEHPTNLSYRCNICENSFDTYKLLTGHKTMHVKNNQLDDLGIKQYYVCKYCNKTFLHYTSLTGHAAQHRQPNPYLCRLCNLSFATYKEVAAHRQTTHPYQSTLHERPNSLYHCQYCEKRFMTELALIKHIRMHTGERPYKCSVCGKGFSQTSGLYTHLKVHSDLRPYTCSQCPQTFKIKGDRDNHVKKHSGNRPYKCDFCERAFMTQHVYSQHRKIHTNERPYKCDICGEAFRRSHVLTVHMRRHTGEKPHTCDLCPKAYRQRGDLLKHKKIHHGVGSSNANNTLSTNTSGTLVKASKVLSTDATTVLLPI